MARAIILGNLGVDYFNLREYQKAIASLGEVLLIARRIGEPGIEATALFNIGDVLHKLGKREEGLLYARRGIRLLTRFDAEGEQNHRARQRVMRMRLHIGVVLGCVCLVGLFGSERGRAATTCAEAAASTAAADTGPLAHATASSKVNGDAHPNGYDPPMMRPETGISRGASTRHLVAPPSTRWCRTTQNTLSSPTGPCRATASRAIQIITE